MNLPKIPSIKFHCCGFQEFQVKTITLVSLNNNHLTFVYRTESCQGSKVRHNGKFKFPKCKRQEGVYIHIEDIENKLEILNEIPKDFKPRLTTKIYSVHEDINFLDIFEYESFEFILEELSYRINIYNQQYPG